MMSEAERRREYRLKQKRERGDKVVGEEAEFLDGLGAAAEVARERDIWHEEHHWRRWHE